MPATTPDTRRLFLDTDSLRAWDTGLVQRFPQPQRVPIRGLDPGGPGSWDARPSSIYGSVLIEDGRYRMWYTCMPDAHSHAEDPDNMLIAYAESDDGIVWRKPDLRLFAADRWPGNSLLALPGCVMGVVPALPATGTRYLACCVVTPLHPESVRPAEFDYRGAGTYFFGSDDGLRWRQLTREPVLAHGDVACLYLDAASNRYLLYQKIGLMHGLDPRRSFIGLTSSDGVHWAGLYPHDWNECFVCDDYDDLTAAKLGFRIADTYGLALYRAGNLYVAVEDVFTIASPLHFRFASNPNGLCHFRLALSHNALNWRYPKGRPEWFTLNPPGHFDAGFAVPASTFVQRGDDLLLYYGASRYDHGWCINPDFSLRSDVALEEQRGSTRIGLLTMRRDRFASLSATYRSRFEVDAGVRGGDAMFVNLACPHGGLRMEVSELGKKEPLPGFAFGDCTPVSGDAVRAPVRFRGGSLAGVPRDKPLTVRFDLSKGEVFGYEWGSA